MLVGQPLVRLAMRQLQTGREFKARSPPAIECDYILMLVSCGTSVCGLITYDWWTIWYLSTFTSKYLYNIHKINNVNKNESYYFRWTARFCFFFNCLLFSGHFLVHNCTTQTEDQAGVNKKKQAFRKLWKIITNKWRHEVHRSVCNT